MKRKFGDCLIELVVGDITTEQTDAIVNAANSALEGGGGVDGAIHQAAGPSLMQQTQDRYPDGCPTGSAVVTDAGKLTAKYVFHAVGPIWRGGRFGEQDALRSAYRSCLELAMDFQCNSIAFPALSTGAYGYPLDLATEAALGEMYQFLQTHQVPTQIRCVLFNEGIFGAYGRVLEKI